MQEPLTLWPERAFPRNICRLAPITRSMRTEPTKPENLPLAWRRDRESTAVDPLAEIRARAVHLEREELPAEFQDGAPRSFMLP